MTKDQIEQKIAKLHEKAFALQKEIAEMEREVVKMAEMEEWPKFGDEYWIIDADGEIENTFYANDSSDKKLMDIGNLFRTSQDAKFAVERLKVLTEMRKFAFEPDWENDDTKKFVLKLLDNIIQVDICYKVNYGFIAFESLDKAQKCIDTIREERLKKYYFGVKDE